MFIIAFIGFKQIHNFTECAKTHAQMCENVQESGVLVHVFICAKIGSCMLGGNLNGLFATGEFSIRRLSSFFSLFILINPLKNTSTLAL